MQFEFQLSLLTVTFKPAWVIDDNAFAVLRRTFSKMQFKSNKKSDSIKIEKVTIRAKDNYVEQIDQLPFERGCSIQFQEWDFNLDMFKAVHVHLQDKQVTINMKGDDNVDLLMAILGLYHPDNLVFYFSLPERLTCFLKGFAPESAPQLKFNVRLWGALEPNHFDFCKYVKEMTVTWIDASLEKCKGIETLIVRYGSKTCGRFPSDLKKLVWESGGDWNRDQDAIIEQHCTWGIPPHVVYPSTLSHDNVAKLTLAGAKMIDTKDD
jgi:hypothetical protein